MKTLIADQKVNINTSWKRYKVYGGNDKFYGKTPFMTPVAHVIDNYGGTGMEYRNAEEIKIGERFRIKGKGVWVVLPQKPMDGDGVRIEKVTK